MDFVSFFAVLATVATVVFSWASYLLSLKEANEDELEGAEQRILELMGRFKHVSGVRLEMLEKKIEEIKRVVREANDVYASLVTKMTDLLKVKEEMLPAVAEELKVETAEKGKPKSQEIAEEKAEEKTKTPDVVENVETDDFEDITTSVEKRILMMHDEGFSDIEIAKKLGIGVGEVRLMISLFRRGR